ncbi:MAG: hypothetical protein R3E68_05040 [Burkholderiaceae bacterium]
MKVGLVWPLDPEIVREFAARLDAIVVVEEKRPLLEGPVACRALQRSKTRQLYGKHANGGLRPEPEGQLFPNRHGEINPGLIAPHAHAKC